MEDCNKIGTLSELKVATELTAQDYHVFIQISGKAPFDLVAEKQGRLWRISVKGTAKNFSTKRGSVEIGLRRTRANRHSTIIHPFSPNECDILAVYIKVLDSVCFIPAVRIKGTNCISIRRERTKYAPSPQFVQSELLRVEG